MVHSAKFILLQTHSKALLMPISLLSAQHFEFTTGNLFKSLKC